MIRSFCGVAVLAALAACQPHHTGPVRESAKSTSMPCYSSDQVLAAIADAGLTGEMDHVKTLAATSEDLLRLQKLPPSSDSTNRAAFDRQVADDIAASIKRFREESAPSAVIQTKKGEFRKNTAIENIAQGVDQIRNSTVVYTASAGEKSLEIGVLINVNGCWKILYL